MGRKLIVDREAMIAKASQAVAALMQKGKPEPKQCAIAALDAVNAFATDRDQIAQTLREVQQFNQELVQAMKEACAALRDERTEGVAARLQLLIDEAEGR